MIEKGKLMCLAAAVLVAIGGCDTLTIPDFNNPGIDELTENPTRSGVIIAAQGLMVGARNGIGSRAGYVSELGIFGRESYNFDPSDPRFITALLQGPLDPGGNAFGGAHWVFRFQNIRNSNIVLNAVDAAADAFTTEEQEAIRGWAKTFQALDFLLVVNTRDDLGAPVDVGGEDPTGPPPPIASRAEVFAHILQLLDEAEGHLNGAGSSFPFQVSSGFAGFSTPADFLSINRALAARVYVYRASIEGNSSDWGEALALLDGGETFINDDPSIDVAGLNIGVYHAYSTSPGDVTLAIFDNSQLVIVPHPSIVTEAQPGDLRLARKVVANQNGTVSDQASLSPAVTTDWAFDIYTSPSSPVPIIRNEELILLRAEANLGAGSPDAALSDINLIRQRSGGLPAIALADWQALTSEQQLDELLYNKRYSLLFEGGHRWIDMRRYSRLTDLPVDHPSFMRFSRFPFPQRECDPREPQPPGCTAELGF